MGITVISGSSATTATPNSSLVNNNLTETLPTGFAALLSGQLKGAITLQGEASLGSPRSGYNTNTDEQTEQITTDPALAFLMATQIPTAAPAPTNDLTVPRDSVAERVSANGKSENALSWLGNTQEKAILNPQNDDKAASTNMFQGLAEQLENASLTQNIRDEKFLPANIAAEPPSGQDSSLVAAGTAQQAARNEAATQVKADIATPLHSSTWTHDFSDKIVWLARNDQQSAQININPPQLGPIQITLQMNGDQASAVFGSPHAEVRQAIENSLPQLKEMLSNAGINLGQADVGANMAQQDRQLPFQAANGNRSASENAILPGGGNVTDSVISTPIQRGRGLVDLFA